MQKRFTTTSVRTLLRPRKEKARYRLETVPGTVLELVFLTDQFH